LISGDTKTTTILGKDIKIRLIPIEKYGKRLFNQKVIIINDKPYILESTNGYFENNLYISFNNLYVRKYIGRPEIGITYSWEKT
jgi:hypothetical protein